MTLGSLKFNSHMAALAHSKAKPKRGNGIWDVTMTVIVQLWVKCQLQKQSTRPVSDKAASSGIRRGKASEESVGTLSTTVSSTNT